MQTPSPSRYGLSDEDPGLGGSRPKESDRVTRRPLETWDRFKILVMLAGAFGILVWSAMASDGVSLQRAAAQAWWVLVLIQLEIIRQLHYVLCEHSAGYYAFWRDRVFGALNARMGRMNDWTRFRIGRAVKLILFIVVLDLVLARIFDLPPATALFQLPLLLVQGMPFLLQGMFLFFVIIIQLVGMVWFMGRGGVDTYMPEDIQTRFDDVWGQDQVLKRVRENLVFLDDPEAIEGRGGYVPGGILLWGPPGTGKTLMAEAVAGETGKPFVFVDPGAFMGPMFGAGLIKIKTLFRKLRKLSVRYGGVIVFFDEADSLGSRGMSVQGGGGPWGGGFSSLTSCNGPAYLDPASRQALAMWDQSSDVAPRRGARDGILMGMGGGGGGQGTLNALLTELSGLKKPRGFLNRHVRRLFGMRPKPPPKYRILVMMATNLPDVLDPALLRPGRIDRIYKVGFPSKKGRIRTYQGYFDKVSHSLNADELDRLATITPYATGASIKDVVNEALINAIRAGRDTIEWGDVVKAKQLKDLGPPEDVEYIQRERHAVAVHEACHAVAAVLVRHHLLIDIATIEKGGTYLGMVASIPPEDQFTRWRSEYEADITVSLASLAGERLFFEGDNSSGVSGDLETATKIATLMEGYWGMGSTVTSHGVTHEVGIGGGGKPGADKGKKEKDLLEGSLGDRIEEHLDELLTKTRDLLAQNKDVILMVAYALETNKTVTGEDIVAIVEGTKGPLVDGRAYHDPAFIRQLHAYHEQAVKAHEDHARVMVDLPLLPHAPTNGHVPVGAVTEAATPPKEPPPRVGA